MHDNNRIQIFIQANCQGQAIKTIISKVPRLKNLFDFYELRPIHLWNDSDRDLVFESIKNCDIFLHQPISDNFGEYSSENLKKYLKKGAKSISFPVVFFSGYNPETIYLKNENKQKVTLFCDYNDYNLVKLFLEEKTVDEAYDIITSEEFYSEEFIIESIENSFTALQNREEGLDIKISDYIRANYRNKKLFYSMNHPINSLLYELINQFLTKEGLEVLKEDETKTFPELLGRTDLYLYHSIAKYLNIESTNTVKIDNKKMELKDMISKYYNAYYKQNELLKYNMDLINNE